MSDRILNLPPERVRLEASLANGEVYPTDDGAVVRLERGAVTGRLVLRVKPKRGTEHVGRCDSLEEAVSKALEWLAEMRLGVRS